MPRGRIELPTPSSSGMRSTTELPRRYSVLSYNPKTLRKFLNKVEGLAEGVVAGWGASAGFS